MKTSQPKRRRTTAAAAGQIAKRNGAGEAADMSAAEMIEPSRLATAGAVLAGVRGAGIHTGGEVAHHTLSASDRARERSLGLNLVSLAAQAFSHLLRDPGFRQDPTPGERELREARRFERRLNVHAVI